MNNTAAPAYRIAARPPWAAAMRDHDCARCEAETLRRPVWLDGPNGVVSVGPVCAARLLGGTGPEVYRRYKAVQAAADEAAADARREAAAVETARWFGWLDSQVPDLAGQVFEQIQRLGGFAAAKALYREAA